MASETRQRIRNKKPTPPEGSLRLTRSGETNIIPQVDLDMYKESIKEYVNWRNRYQENKEKLYEIIWGQCSDSMQSKLQSRNNFNHIDEKRDCLELLREIKGMMFNFESQQNSIFSMHLACQKYFNMKQGKYESLSDYYKRFCTVLDVLEHYGANVWAHPSLIVNKYKRDGNMDITNNNIYSDMSTFKKNHKNNKTKVHRLRLHKRSI